jgi:hypothetical protein
MLAAFVLLLLVCALAVIAMSFTLVWMFLGEEGREPAAGHQPLSLSDLVARETQKRQVWRALSAWFSAKPPRIEDHRSPDKGRR